MNTFGKTKFDEVKFIWMSFGLAALIMLLAYILLGYYPFGNNTIMRIDLYHQYGPFHEELRNRLVNGQSLFYSWEGGLGKEFLSQLAYYTASPLSFLMVLFPQVNMPEAMALFALIKIAASAGFFAFFIKRKFGKNDFTIVIFSLMYSSMAFLSCYYWNVMWLDAVALFPLVALGIESLVKDGKFKMYAISLTIVIIVNFYIAFIVCVFAVLYYLVLLFTEYSYKKDKEIIIKRTITFAVVSALAGGISMFLTIPTAVALSHTTTSDSSFPSFKIYDNIYQIITNHFAGARPVVLGRNEDLPNIYTGVLTMILLPVYFFNKKIAKKEKVLYASIIIFMLLCSCINVLDYIIHGLHFPSNLPHRFTFIYSFILLTMAYKAFINIKTADYKKCIYTSIGYVAVILLTEYIITPLNSDVDRVLSDVDILINVFLGATYVLFVLTLIKKNTSEKAKRTQHGWIFVIVFVECIFSVGTGLNSVGTTSRPKYIQYIDGINNAISFIEEKDGNEFNRTEESRFTTINDSALYHYKGFSQFSSLAYGGTSKMMQDIGIAATGNSYRFYDPTPLIDSMFNIKYILQKDKDGEPKGDSYEKIYDAPNLNIEKYEKVKKFIAEKGVDIKDVTNLNSENQEELKNIAGVENLGDIPGVSDEGKSKYVYVYENKYALPLGFVVDETINDWDTSAIQCPFGVQNDFIKKTTGIDEEFLTEIDISEFAYENLELTNKKDDDFDYERQENGINNVNKYKLTRPADMSENAKPKMTATVNVGEKGEEGKKRVFLYIDSSNSKTFTYSVGNGGDQTRELSTGRSLIDVGYVDCGEKINIKFFLDNKGEFEKTYRKTGTVYLYAAYYNDDVFAKIQKELASEPFKITEYGDDYINGTVETNGGVLYTSIPYDEGWQVTVDGEEKDIVSIANDGLLGIELEKGVHEIKLSYYPKGFNLGIAVSVVSLILFVGLCIRKKVV